MHITTMAAMVSFLRFFYNGWFQDTENLLPRYFLQNEPHERTFQCAPWFTVHKMWFDGCLCEKFDSSVTKKRTCSWNFCPETYTASLCMWQPRNDAIRPYFHSLKLLHRSMNGRFSFTSKYNWQPLPVTVRLPCLQSECRHIPSVQSPTKHGRQIATSIFWRRRCLGQ